MSTHSGAESAYRGYWWQFLYTLHRLLLTHEEGLIFHPEGNEDLAIYDKRYQLVEAIQVKDYSDNLTISDFLKKDKKDSFFHRTIKNFKKYPPTKIKIVSFGPIGPEMHKAWQGEERAQISVGNKLKERGFLEDDIKLLIEKIHTKNFVLETVAKDILKQEVENVLNEIA